MRRKNSKFSFFGPERVNKVDYEIKKPIILKGGKIIGILKPNPSPFGTSEDNHPEDFENLIEGILTGDINLVKLALEPGNITYNSSTGVAVEKNGLKEVENFSPLFEAYHSGNKEIIDYIKEKFFVDLDWT